jgi:transitional endoplasmic reticulum ATPase
MTDPEPMVVLRVADSGIGDVAEGRARISRDQFAALGLTAGALIRISAAEKILADAYPAGAEDDGLSLVRLDGTQRHRLQVRIGDMVDVRPYESANAKVVRCVALGSNRALDVSPYDVHSALVGQTVTRGDTFSISPARRDFEASVSLLGLSVVDVVGSSAGAHAALIRVAETTPPGAVRIVAETEIEILRGGDSDSGAEDDL